MKTIWKFELEMKPTQIVSMPVGSKMLTVQIQNHRPMLWAICDPEYQSCDYLVSMIGTGSHVFEVSGQYVATFQIGPMVFHVFVI